MRELLSKIFKSSFKFRICSVVVTIKLGNNVYNLKYINKDFYSWMSLWNIYNLVILQPKCHICYNTLAFLSFELIMFIACQQEFIECGLSFSLCHTPSGATDKKKYFPDIFIFMRDV